MIHYISPYRSDKNIGKAINDEIGHFPEGDWICLTDADSMPLLPDYGTQIEEIVSKYGRQYGLIGCSTNRLGREEQLYAGFSEDADVRNHKEIAEEAKAKWGSEVHPLEKGYVAGLCMIFSVKTWKMVGGFREGYLTWDTDFNRRVRAKNKKIGIAPGLYMFHLYRIDIRIIFFQ